jgi:hypothetical protein
MRLTRWSTRLGACVVAAAVAAVDASAQSRLTFEDLCYSSIPRCGVEAPTILFAGGPLITDYAGFSWTSFRALDLDNYPLHRPNPDPGATGSAGYPLDPAAYGTVLGLGFGQVVVERPTGAARERFQFQDMALGAGWTSGMTLGITGLLGGASVFSQSLTLSATSSSLIDLPDQWIDQLVMTPTFTPPGYTDPYGSARFNAGTPFQTFWFDNVGYRVAAASTVPEPATVALVGGGLLVLGLTTRRRRRLRA